jgi:hypothetical protein
MLNRNDIRRAVDMQRHSYRLLKWMAKAVEEGFIEFETAHEYSSLPEAAEAWILRHYLNIPSGARVAREDLGDFCAFFSTYLENSFDLVPSPGKHLYSPDAHCFCPMCSWLVNAPNLKTKKLTPSDKRRARKMQEATIRDIAAERDVLLTDEDVDAIVDDPRLREVISLVTYGHDLLRRMKGIAAGPAVLALWRRFAWTESGSPKHGFRLKADAIFHAEKQLSDIVLPCAGNKH